MPVLGELLHIADDAAAHEVRVDPGDGDGMGAPGARTLWRIFPPTAISASFYGWLPPACSFKPPWTQLDVFSDQKTGREVDFPEVVIFEHSSRHRVRAAHNRTVNDVRSGISVMLANLHGVSSVRATKRVRNVLHQYCENRYQSILVRSSLGWDLIPGSTVLACELDG
jgi:hypothetical protein